MGHDSSATSIRQISHIKSLFINMLHRTKNLRYSRHIITISCVDLASFLLTINLDVVSSFNVFNNDDVFSTRTRLGHAGFAGPVC